MGASLAVISANIWMKTFEEKPSAEVEMSLGETKSSKQICPCCHKKWLGIAMLSKTKNIRICIT